MRGKFFSFDTIGKTLKLDIKTGNPCSLQKDFCRNCHNHYAELRPSITGVVVSNRFLNDNKDDETSEAIIEQILDCSHLQFTELHKFEKKVDRFLIFRAKIDSSHVVYSIDKENKIIIFMRMIKNFSEYKRFLEDDRKIKKLIQRSI